MEKPETIQGHMQSYRKNSAKYGTTLFNPFKEDIHAKLIYLIGRQPAMQQGEIWEFFNPLKKEDEAINKDKQGNYYRDRRNVNQTINKYLKELEKQNIITKKLVMKKPITFDPTTFEILLYEIKINGGHNDEPSKPMRYYLKEPLFKLLVKAFKIEDYFTGKVDFSKKQKGFEKLTELTKHDLENPAIQHDIKKALGLSEFNKEQALKELDTKKQIMQMQSITDVCQKRIRPDFLEKLTVDFEEYYNVTGIRNLKKPLQEIYLKETFSINYYQILYNFLKHIFHKDIKHGAYRSYNKKRYNYPETFLLGQVRIQLHYKETGFLEEWTELHNLRNLWTNADPIARSIDIGYQKQFFKKQKKIKLKDGHLPSSITH
jgi:hypothetical protein